MIYRKLYKKTLRNLYVDFRKPEANIKKQIYKISSNGLFILRVEVSLTCVYNNVVFMSL